MGTAGHQQDRPYTLTTKCVEIFHWRHGVVTDETGELRMDEAIVERRVGESLSEPLRTLRILKTMLRLRDPSGVYARGGCVDASREFPVNICEGTSGIALPDAAG